MKRIIKLVMLFCIITAFLYAGDSYIKIYSGSHMILTSADDDKSYIINTGDDTGVITVNNGASLTSWSPSALVDLSVTGGGDITLPVNLSSFYALYTVGTPTLYWTTQTEENNAYWNVYRGTTDNFENSININANSPVPGNGTTNSATDYVYVDIAPVVQNATYWYWIEDVSTDGETELHDPIILSIPFEDTPITPESYGLNQNYPNPFNPSTSISFTLAEDSNVELIIYNAKGKKVKTIFNDPVYTDQINSAIWNGKDASGKQVSSGIYFYKLITETQEYQKKMLLVK
ncbi:MAG: T9SS type A sorting domain-containing protein [Candidatus Cloacimonetes bacterium]|nr:T9SS type A sorting domain-containing protein [Candidatus Cloacimonadota bacterium]